MLLQDDRDLECMYSNISLEFFSIHIWFTPTLQYFVLAVLTIYVLPQYLIYCSTLSVQSISKLPKVLWQYINSKYWQSIAIKTSIVAIQKYFIRQSIAINNALWQFRNTLYWQSTAINKVLWQYINSQHCQYKVLQCWRESDVYTEEL
jgi:hypothetical protein